MERNTYTEEEWGQGTFQARSHQIDVWDRFLCVFGIACVAEPQQHVYYRDKEPSQTSIDKYYKDLKNKTPFERARSLLFLPQSWPKLLLAVREKERKEYEKKKKTEAVNRQRASKKRQQRAAIKKKPAQP